MINNISRYTEVRSAPGWTWRSDLLSTRLGRCVCVFIGWWGRGGVHDAHRHTQLCSARRACKARGNADLVCQTRPPRDESFPSRGCRRPSWSRGRRPWASRWSCTTWRWVCHPRCRPRSWCSGARGPAARQSASGTAGVPSLPSQPARGFQHQTWAAAALVQFQGFCEKAEKWHIWKKWKKTNKYGLRENVLDADKQSWFFKSRKPNPPIMRLTITTDHLEHEWKIYIYEKWPFGWRNDWSLTHTHQHFGN